MGAWQLSRLPDGVEGEPRALAILKAEPEELTREKGIEFARVEDEDLGPMLWAVVEVGGEPFVLEKYELGLQDGTTLSGWSDPEPFLAGFGLPAIALSPDDG